MFDRSSTLQTILPAQQSNLAEGNDQFLTFDDPFLTAQCQDASAPDAFCNWDESGTIERLHQLLRNGCMAIGRAEIENLIARTLRSCPEDMQLALAELCLEINMLSGVSADIGNRINVWFDSHSQRLNVKTAAGEADSISISHLFVRRTD